MTPGRPLTEPIGHRDPYAALGTGYGARRRADPRWRAMVDRALAGASTVVNIGAGTGSYEPSTTALAVEPSPTMIGQRPADSAPVVQALAEAIPLPERAVDAALAVLTVHHWADPAAGIAEMIRVSGRQVVLTWDPAHLARTFWLVTDYLPQIADHEAHLACHDRIVREFDAHGRFVHVIEVPVPDDCRDGVLAAHWARPHAYLDPVTHAAASGLARLSARVVEPALDRLREDLASGRWHRRHGRLLARAELDLGYRLVIAADPTPGVRGAQRGV